VTATRISTWTRRHLLDVDELSRAELEAVLDLGVELRGRRAAGELPDSLRGMAVGLAFYEPSTRTRVSFELAARELGATVTDLSVAGSSAAKGESLIDTLRTLERTGVRMVVLRHPASGAPYLAARSLERAAILNAGDGTHAHPTQALLDALTLREALGSLEGARVVIVGDAAHSRVARSDLHALVRLGASVVLSGPPAWVNPFAGWPGVSVVTDLDAALTGADAVMALRVQRERAADSGVPSLGEYVARWGLAAEKLERACPGAWLMHPGPVNEGVEIAAELSTDPRSLIGRQVENGVPIRMAVLSLLAAELDRW
jgi:aspartate carbamoyltransferase catalytic subunit